MSKKELLAKIEKLERDNADLLRRVAMLEARPVYPVYPAPKQDDWRDGKGPYWLPPVICGNSTVPQPMRPGEVRITRGG